MFRPLPSYRPSIRRRSLRIRPLLLAGLACSLTGFAETEISAHVISGGGGKSVAEQITLSGTLGQSVAGISSEQETSLSAGFWFASLQVEVIYDNAFEQWMASLPPKDQPPEGQRGPNDTPAGDGVANLLKFAFGILPMEPAADAAPRMSVEGEERFLGIEFIRSKTADVELTIYGSPDLVSWSELPHVENIGSSVTLPAHREQVRLVTGLTKESHPDYFLRLQVEIH